MQKLDRKYMVDIGAMPFTTSNCTRNQFRIIANLRQKVDHSTLQKAVNMVTPRFPMFTVAMKKRWNSLSEYKTQDIKIEVIKYSNQFKPFELYSGEPLFRVMYGEKFVCVEMFHTISDANGCLALLNSILSCYYELLGMEVDKSNIIQHDSEYAEEEFEDGYFKYATKEKAQISNTKSLLNKNFKIKSKAIPDRQGVVNIYSFDLEGLKNVAKDKNLTIHEYLVLVLCTTFGQIKSECNSKKITRIQMAINLRNRFPSKTLRNFVGTTQFETKSSDEKAIIQEFKKHMEIATSEKELTAFMWSAVSLMYGVLRFLPRFLGNFLLRTGDKVLGEKANSTSLSNLGIVKSNLNKCGVISYEFIEGTPLYIPFLVSAISYNNVCNIVFSKNTNNSTFEKLFLQRLKQDNITLLKSIVRK